MDNLVKLYRSKVEPRRTGSDSQSSVGLPFQVDEATAQATAVSTSTSTPKAAAVTPLLLLDINDQTTSSTTGQPEAPQTLLAHHGHGVAWPPSRGFLTIMGEASCNEYSWLDFLQNIREAYKTHNVYDLCGPISEEEKENVRAFAQKIKVFYLARSYLLLSSPDPTHYGHEGPPTLSPLVLDQLATLQDDGKTLFPNLRCLTIDDPLDFAFSSSFLARNLTQLSIVQIPDNLMEDFIQFLRQLSTHALGLSNIDIVHTRLEADLLDALTLFRHSLTLLMLRAGTARSKPPLRIAGTNEAKCNLACPASFLDFVGRFGRLRHFDIDFPMRPTSCGCAGGNRKTKWWSKTSHVKHRFDMLGLRGTPTDLSMLFAPGNQIEVTRFLSLDLCTEVTTSLLQAKKKGIDLLWERLADVRMPPQVHFVYNTPSMNANITPQIVFESLLQTLTITQLSLSLTDIDLEQVIATSIRSTQNPQAQRTGPLGFPQVTQLMLSHYNSPVSFDSFIKLAEIFPNAQILGFAVFPVTMTPRDSPPTVDVKQEAPQSLCSPSDSMGNPCLPLSIRKVAPRVHPLHSLWIMLMRPQTHGIGQPESLDSGPQIRGGEGAVGASVDSEHIAGMARLLMETFPNLRGDQIYVQETQMDLVETWGRVKAAMNGLGCVMGM